VINETREHNAGATSLPQMLSLAVHELRTPVTVVGGYLRMLLRGQAGPLTDKQRWMLEEADRSCARIGTLVAEMSELGKLESREHDLTGVPFDLAAVVAEVAAGMSESDRDVRLEARGCDQPVTVTGDRTRIATAIRALLHAAARERVEPGAIVAECKIVGTWGVVAIGDETQLLALTRDAGAAAATFDEWRGGTGLSLPLARRVVEAHGGAVWSASDGASRATAGLRLPLVP
jgi:signal transduction histidine kinase